MIDFERDDLVYVENEYARNNGTLGEVTGLESGGRVCAGIGYARDDGTLGEVTWLESDCLVCVESDLDDDPESPVQIHAQLPVEHIGLELADLVSM